jgi:hypothetical protein
MHRKHAAQRCRPRAVQNDFIAVTDQHQYPRNLQHCAPEFGIGPRSRSSRSCRCLSLCWRLAALAASQAPFSLRGWLVREKRRLSTFWQSRFPPAFPDKAHSAGALQARSIYVRHNRMVHGRVRRAGRLSRLRSPNGGRMRTCSPILHENECGRREEARFRLHDTAGDNGANFWGPALVVHLSDRRWANSQASHAQWRLHLRVPPRPSARLSVSA